MDYIFLEVLILSSLIPLSSCSYVYGNYSQLNDAICFQDIPLTYLSSLNICCTRHCYTLAQKAMQKVPALKELSQMGLKVPKVTVFLVPQSNGTFHMSSVRRMHTHPIVASVGLGVGIFREGFLEMTLELSLKK